MLILMTHQALAQALQRFSLCDHHAELPQSPKVEEGNKELV